MLDIKRLIVIIWLFVLMPLIVTFLQYFLLILAALSSLGGSLFNPVSSSNGLLASAILLVGNIILFTIVFFEAEMVFRHWGARLVFATLVIVGSITSYFLLGIAGKL